MKTGCNCTNSVLGLQHRRCYFCAGLYIHVPNSKLGANILAGGEHSANNAEHGAASVVPLCGWHTSDFCLSTFFAAQQCWATNFERLASSYYVCETQFIVALQLPTDAFLNRLAFKLTWLTLTCKLSIAVQRAYLRMWSTTYRRPLCVQQWLNGTESD